jgi:16S rRNA (guanine527-N7)-methyltransferase
MVETDIILKYFPDLTQNQVEQFRQLGILYPDWNRKINVISRQDIGNLYTHHILHSLGIAKVIWFRPGSAILDAGTGGGFPGIPLAILFPEVQFHLIDSTAKKISVVNAIVADISLKNVTAGHLRLEDHRNRYDFVVSRAVATLDQMMRWVHKNIRQEGFNELKNGLLYLKGGDLTEELNGMEAGRQESREAGKPRGWGGNYRIYELSDFFSEPFFETKKVIHLFS